MISTTDAVALDQALETALNERHFINIRKVLLVWGYRIPKDESESDLYKALVQSMGIDLEDDVEIDEATGLTVYIEKLIRNRNLDELRLMLFMNGHKIEKPNFMRQLAAKQGPSECAEECPVCFPHSSPEPL